MSALDGFGPATRAWFEASFGAPTPVQAQGWPKIASGAHTLMVAPTGSGKTLAAFLVGLDRLARRPADAPDGVRVLYVSPLKALVYDIERNLRSPLAGIARTAATLGEHVQPIRIDIRTGDTPQDVRRRQARTPGDVLVTTPESLYLILTSEARSTLSTVHTVILDEIHVLSGTKRGVHLALSLERLEALTESPPQRLGLSATQRPLDVAARFLGGDRPVEIVDTSEPPRLDLRIVVPVEDMDNPVPPPERFALEADGEDGPDLDDLGFGGPVTRLNPPATGNTSALQSGIWPSIHPRLLELIRQHRSTLLFTNSRLLCERLSQALNELAGEELVRAHHGSISHERRADIEEQLKRGEIPAIVATSSLELGIDMGAVDLVILVESPGSAARGLQRIGRAGHQVGATSQGRLFPKFRGDLLESAVVARHMAEGRIEATRMPVNCLDVLGQQVVAMVAEKPWTVDEVLSLVRRAAPYAGLTRELLVTLLDMLSGRYPSDAFADLTPSLTWDRTTDTLEARRGTRLLAVLNGGTIPDRGLYRVHLGEDGPRLGELDEEMVFESREGDTIVLGATSWRITSITRDKVIVQPAPGQPGRLAFWRGERPGRPLELGRALGAFLRELEPLSPEAAEDHLVETTPMDALAARNLAAYVAEQKEATGTLPTDRRITLERFRDELGDWRVCLLTPFGSRVHAPWALALEALLSQRAGFDVTAFWSDDGIALRFSDGDDVPGADRFLPDPEEVEDLVVEQLRHAAVFAARFRENAARALLLPRRRGSRRTPLWLQRKKSSDLLSVAQQFPAFPIVLETYRECLQDVFDLPALVEILTAIRSRAITVDEVDTRAASPFARSLVFQYIAAYLYDGDTPLAERKAQALALDRNLLRELLGQEQLRDLLDADAVAQVEAELQHLTPDRAVRHVDGLHDLLRRLGDLNDLEVAARCAGDAAAWLAQLARERRAVQIRLGGEARWIAVEDAARYRDALGVALPGGLPAIFLEPVEEPVEGLIRRHARTHGPFHADEVALRFGLTTAIVEAVLRGLEAQGLLLHGELRPGGTRREWCDQEVLRRLRQRSLAVLRRQVAPVDGDVYARFLPVWHGFDRTSGGLGRLSDVVDQLEGVAIPFSILESEVLASRVPGYQAIQLDQLGAMGEVVWIGRGALGTADGRVALYRRTRVPLLVDLPAAAPPRSGLHARLLDHLRTRGASFLVELQTATGNPSARDLVTALWDLVWDGLVTNDTFQPLRGLADPGGRRQDRLVRVAGGRWSAVETLVGAAAAPTQRALARATTLLERYGVVSREVASVEEIPGGFSALYPVFREMESSGRVRRGWYVDGLSGAQFALPGAVDRLRSHREDERVVRRLAAADPANPWGAQLPWPPTADPTSKPRRAAGATLLTVGGVPAVYLSKGGRGLVLFQAVLEEEDLLDAAVEALRAPLDYRTLRIDKVDGHPALEHPQLPRLLRAGFQRDFKGLLLTRSR